MSTKRTKHTRGPWVAKPLICDEVPDIGISSEGRWVDLAGVYLPRLEAKVPEAMANVRLITAAPELLAALKSLTNAVVSEVGYGEDELVELHRAKAVAMEVIAKVEGQS